MQKRRTSGGKKIPGDKPARPPAKQALAALRLLFQAFPAETLGWLMGRAGQSAPGAPLEVTLLDPPRPGPAYAVPPAKEEPGSLSRVFAQALATDITRSSPEHSVQVLSLDMDEMVRQTWLAGGGDLQLALAYKENGHTKFSVACLFVAGPTENGSRMPKKVSDKLAWQLLAHQRLVAAAGEPPSDMDIFFLPLYLWPATGLKDPQELASVLPRPTRGGGLGAWLDAALQHNPTRETNEARVAYHEKLHEERRQAARKRQARMNDAGISETELRALLPKVDVKNDRISLWVTYEILRLWETPAGELLPTLPRECVGLALFGHLPAGDSPDDWIYRCGWALRAGLRGANDQRRYQAASEALVALAACRWPRGDVLAALAPLHLPLGR